jgi:hypothetical protein
MYCYIWSYLVRPEYSPAFRIAYDPDGAWVQFFRRDPEYVRTEFLGDVDNPTHFLTIDFWRSREACESFRARFRSEFEALDKSFEHMTVQENHLGSFDVLTL